MMENWPSHEENVLESALELSDRVYIATRWPTEKQKQNARNLSYSERKELFAFVQWNQLAINTLLSTETPEQLKQLQQEIIVEWRLKEMYFSKSTETQWYVDSDGINKIDQYYRIVRQHTDHRITQFSHT